MEIFIEQIQNKIRSGRTITEIAAKAKVKLDAVVRLLNGYEEKETIDALLKACVIKHMPLSNFTGRTITTKEAAWDKGVSPATVRKYCHRGVLNYTKKGNRILVIVDETYENLLESELGSIRKEAYKLLEENKQLKNEIETFDEATVFDEGYLSALADVAKEDRFTQDTIKKVIGCDFGVYAKAYKKLEPCSRQQLYFMFEKDVEIGGDKENLPVPEKGQEICISCTQWEYDTKKCANCKSGVCQECVITEDGINYCGVDCYDALNDKEEDEDAL